MSKKVMIPSHMIPCFVCDVNGRKYMYPAGTIQEVPDDVASVIENFWEMKPEPEVTEQTDVPVVEPQEEDIPKVFFGSALPQTKDDLVMSFRYISKTEDISGYCKTKAQGNSSMSYPKKNQTVKLYKDADCAEKLEVDFKGWGKQNKFCFKANWIDLTHARNIVSARLWGDVVKSRAGYDQIPEQLRTSPNQGAVDGFPVKVYADGIYQGRYTINIPKDAWMANMDEEQDSHCILCGENYVSGCFRAEAKIDETDWTDEVHKTVPASIKNRWNDAIRFVMNSSDEEFVAGIGHYFDVPSLIDYYIFGLVSCGLDAFGKNQLYMTYDGMKWYATMYDMDSTWGLWWDGSKFVSAEYARKEYQDFKGGNGNLLYIRLESLFADDITARWDELKNGALSVDSIINSFERFTDIAPPYLVGEDYADSTAYGAFTAIPQKDAGNIQQIRSFIRDRFAYVNHDNKIDYTLDPLASVTWNNNKSYAKWTNAGTMEDSQGEQCTSKFTLQNCLYEMNFGGYQYPAIFIWDQNGVFVTYGQYNGGNAHLTGVEGYTYAIKVYAPDGFDPTTVSFLPVDTEVSKGESIVFTPAEMEWSAGTGLETIIPASQMWNVASNDDLASKLHHANAILSAGRHFAEGTASDGHAVFIGSMEYWDGNVYLRTWAYGTNVTNALKMFADNNVTIVLNG